MQSADERIDLAIAERTGLVEDLETDSEQGGAPAGHAQAQGEARSSLKSILHEAEERWQKVVERFDDSQQGYFATPDRSIYGIRIVSSTSGTGDRGGAALLDQVAADVRDLDPAKYDPGMVIGYAPTLWRSPGRR